MEVSRIQSLGRDPIPGGDPAGENARYDGEYEQVAAEIGKLESIEQEVVDYYQVERLGMDLLEARTKDLKIAAWLCVALSRQNGTWGLAHGLGLCRDLLVNFWEPMFPPVARLRARMTLLEWLAEIVEKDLDKLPEPTENDRDALDLCLSNFEAIDSLAKDKFAGDEPALGPALRALRTRIGAIPEPEPEPEPESITPATEATSESAAAPPPPPPAPKEMSTPEDVTEALGEWRDEMRKAAAILRRDAPDAPAGYRLLRQACWGDLHRLPEADAEQQLADSCPGDDFVTTTERLLAEEEFEEALETIETVLAATPLWLDLNLLACRALEGLGRKYRKVKRAIEGDLTALLAQLPGLIDYRFADGRPIASDETRIWIENELRGAPATATGDEGEGDPNSVEFISAEARRLLTRKKINEAVTLLVRHIDSANSRRTRFLLRLELARLCVEAGNPGMAVPQLDLLDQEVETFSLEEWEPDLSVQVVRLLWQCCSGKKKVEALTERADSIYDRLCRLDPAAAFAMKRP